MKCSTCGKALGDADNFWYAALQAHIPNTGQFFADTNAYLQRQFGPYEIDNYRFCFECVLRAMGVPEPVRQ